MKHQLNQVDENTAKSALAGGEHNAVIDQQKSLREAFALQPSEPGGLQTPISSLLSNPTHPTVSWSMPLKVASNLLIALNGLANRAI